MRPVKLEIPIKTSHCEFGDLSVSAVLATEDFVPDVEDSWYFAQVISWILPDSMSFSGRMQEADSARFTVHGTEGSCLPVCLGIWPLPSGFWHNDWLATGIALPASYNFNSCPEVMCGAAVITLRREDMTVGIGSIWHDEWTPLYPKGGNTRCGMVTQMRVIDLEKTQEIHGMKLGWVAQLRIWSRERDYGEYALSTRRQFFHDV